jgi:oligopeptide/dipeptide ABC transporter ATP-binding protein
MTPSVPDPVLSVANLSVSFGGRTEAVRGVSLAVGRGETHCVVGESGCGKSISALSVMNLLPRGATRTADHIRFQGQDLLDLSERQIARLRGDKIAMIFQEPMTSLNPAYTIGSQMSEVLERHRRATRRQAMDRAAELLARVGITAPGMRLGQYPHQLSGGLRQRMMIAMALMCDPELLIADEPTTALDVTVQAQIIELLRELNRDLGTAIILITHDMGVVAGLADDVMVMYAGRTVERASAQALFENPTHPYTRGLLDALPRLDDADGSHDIDAPLRTIAGNPPAPGEAIEGCAFAPRCALAKDRCHTTRPELEAIAGQPDGWRACLRPVGEMMEVVR